VPTNTDRLASLLRARRPGIWISTTEEAQALRLIDEAAGRLGAHVWSWSVIDGVRRRSNAGAGAIADTMNPGAAMYWLAQQEAPGVIVLLDVAAHLGEAHAMRALRQLLDRAGRLGSSVILLDHAPDLPRPIREHVTPFELALPRKEEIESIVRRTLRRIHRETPLTVDLTERDYQLILKNLSGLSERQITQIITDVAGEDRLFDARDLNDVLAHKRLLVSGAGPLEYVESPATLDEVGGLARLKGWLRAREESFSERAEGYGLTPPRGVLLLGVQGAGKSLCAKAIATAWQRPLLRMDPGALYDRYVGESERRLRDALAQAEAMAPNVLWIDEIEKAFASAAAHSTDGGLSQRMFGALLTWMQDHEAPVFLVATANNIDALPPELLRKGRFDEIFFVDLPSPEARRDIFRIHLQRRGRTPADFDLDQLARVSEGYSGAEIEAAILGALHDCFSRGDEPGTEDLVRAVNASPPLSVTMRERIARLRSWADGRCVLAD
jgi:SpoVK/Ycf46/Vps4 family AAA+-type ATPase